MIMQLPRPHTRAAGELKYAPHWRERINRRGHAV
jgi:hypothetical protein